jgi:hypothetical protein
MQDDVGEIIPTHMGDILLNRPGELYVGSLFVCKTNTKFGYNVEPLYLKLERDRNTVAGWDLEYMTYSIWKLTERWDKIAELIEAGAPDTVDFKFSSPALVKEACYKRFLEANPGAVPISTQEELDDLVYNSLVKTVFVNANYQANIVQSEEYLRNVAAIVYSPPPPYDILYAWQETHRDSMSSYALEQFESILDISKKWK